MALALWQGRDVTEYHHHLSDPLPLCSAPLLLPLDGPTAQWGPGVGLNTFLPALAVLPILTAPIPTTSP